MLKRGWQGWFLLEAAGQAGSISLLFPASGGCLSTCPHSNSDPPVLASSLRGTQLFKNG